MFGFERRVSRSALVVLVAVVFGCAGGSGHRPGEVPPSIEPIVFARGVRTSVKRIDATVFESSNQDIKNAFGNGGVYTDDEEEVVDVTIPNAVPLGKHDLTITSDIGTRNPTSIYVLDDSTPSMLELSGNEVELGVTAEAVALTINPPGPTTIEFEVPTGVTPELTGDTWRSTTVPFDSGLATLTPIKYRLNGNLSPGRYPFKMLWKRASETLAEVSGTIRVAEVPNKVQVFNSRFNAPGNFTWSFAEGAIQRNIGPTSTTISVSDANRSITISANKPLPPGQYFVPTDVQVEYRQRTNTYECAYGYVVIEENSSGELYLRMREMSMMASGTTLQGYFSMEGIIRRSF